MKLPPGWTREVALRRAGASAGKSDVYVFSPGKLKKFRSRNELKKYLSLRKSQWGIDDFDKNLFSKRGIFKKSISIPSRPKVSGRSVNIKTRTSRNKNILKSRKKNCVQKLINPRKRKHKDIDHDSGISEVKEDVDDLDVTEFHIPNRKKESARRSRRVGKSNNRTYKSSKVHAKSGRKRKRQEHTSGDIIATVVKQEQDDSGLPTEIKQEVPSKCDVGIQCSIIPTPCIFSEPLEETVRRIPEIVALTLLESKYMLRRSDREWNFPSSPYNLIQEQYQNQPWPLLVSTIFIKVADTKMTRKLCREFLYFFDTPQKLQGTPSEIISAFLERYGLRPAVAKKIKKFTNEFLNKRWTYPRELYGITKFGDDCYRIFCMKEWNVVKPHEHVLQCYQNWLANICMIRD